MKYQQDTIAAISTAQGAGGIAIVRISGPRAICEGDRIYRGKQTLKETGAGTIRHGYIIRDDESRIDEVLVSVFRAPKSYTGEDTVEINCHGGALSARLILEEVLRGEVRLAEPGEFTKRAFLSGRIDLSQAEAVMEVIAAGSEHAQRASEQRLHGALANEVRAIREALLHETAFIEAALDDPEHFDIDAHRAELEETLSKQLEKIRTLLSRADEGRMIQDGIRTVIAGLPNVGKSSLLNALAGEERAIVTDTAGTTRDVLTEQINLRGITLILSDTAGIRESDNEIEQIGVARARSQAESADLILFVTDGTKALTEEDLEILRLAKGREVIAICNKSDLPSATSEKELAEKLAMPVIAVSAKTGEGLDELADEIAKRFFGGKLAAGDELYIAKARQKEALEEAQMSLSQALLAAQEVMPEDFVSIDLMSACDALGRITGESADEDLIRTIFAEFCLGK